MENKYLDWIEKCLPTAEDAYGDCIYFSQLMASVFPELRLAYGTFEDLIWGVRWHQWCVAPNGEIVDPTVKQFPFPCGPYVEKREDQRPVGRCANCGQLYYKLYDGTVCGEICGIQFAQELNKLPMSPRFRNTLELVDKGHILC